MNKKLADLNYRLNELKEKRDFLPSQMRDARQLLEIVMQNITCCCKSIEAAIQTECLSEEMESSLRGELEVLREWKDKIYPMMEFFNHYGA